MTNISQSDSPYRNGPPGATNGQTDFERLHQSHDSGPENHRALIYESREEQFAATIPFVRDGLEQNERVMYVADENTEDELIDAFEAAGIDVDAVLASGALTFHTMADTYGEPAEFHPEQMIDSFDEMVREVVEDDDYDRLRVAAEMTWVLGEDTETQDRLVEYEGKLNEFFPQKPVIGLCQYNRERFSPDLLYDIIRAHPHQVYNATVTQNLAYLPPDEFFEANPLSGDVEEFVDANLDRIRAHAKRKDRERTLTALASSSEALVEGDSEAIIDRTITTLKRGLSPTFAAVFFYDDEADELRPQAISDLAGGDTESVILPEQYVGMLRDTFITADAKVFSNFQSESEIQPLNTVLQSGMAFPLDRYGVLFVGSTCPYAFDQSDVDFAETVARSTQVALKRAEHERTLEEQNEQLEHLNYINRTIRRIDRALVQASSREEIETVVCNQLAKTDSYRFVWIGDSDPLTTQFIPGKWAGDGAQYLEELYSLGEANGTDKTADEPGVIPNPSRTAAETGAVCSVPNILTTKDFDEWRQVALFNDFYSALSIPLGYNDAEYGVLNVYMGEPNVLTEMEQTVLQELGATIAYTIDAVETKASLQADRVTQVGLRITDSDSRLLRLARNTNSTIDVQTVLPLIEDGLRLFFTVPDAPADAILSTAEESVNVETIRRISDREQGTLFEAELDVDAAVLTALTASNGSVTSLTATSEAVELLVELPQSADVRTFVDRFTETYPETEVASIKRVSRPSRTSESFYANVEERLTDRQLEALQVAYHSGYFEWPRENSATDVSESMDVTQPTFSGHLRAGEKKLLSLLFGEEST